MPRSTMLYEPCENHNDRYHERGRELDPSCPTCASIIGCDMCEVWLVPNADCTNGPHNARQAAEASKADQPIGAYISRDKHGRWHYSFTGPHGTAAATTTTLRVTLIELLEFLEAHGAGAYDVIQQR